MKKLEKRSIICLTMAAVLFLGVCVFTYRFVTQGLSLIHISPAGSAW